MSAENATLKNNLWHTLTAKETFHAVAGIPDGLSEEEAAARLELYGANALQAAKPISFTTRFLRQFNNALIYVLMGAALITGIMQHWTDTGVIATVILINALIGFFQEQKAEAALLAIRNLLSPRATVLRGGIPHLIAAELLVPGDIVLLTAGDKVPADIRLLEVHSLRVQEAILTGESLDVDKAADPVLQEAALGERSCLAYSGTLVTAGQAKGIVVATGGGSQIGQISGLLRGTESPQTPLAVKLARFSRLLAAFIVLLSIGVFLFGIFIRHTPMDEMFMVMIGIAVSAIPEGLPAIISITMALGVRAMAKRNAIVRHLPVIEALGSVTVICTDKTGTLTKNELAVTDIVTAEHSFNVKGAGYSPEGNILLHEEEITLAEHPTVHDMGLAAMLNNDSVLTLKANSWELNGDPTEGALMAFACKTGQEQKKTEGSWPRTDVIPFSAEQRYMATLHHSSKGEGIIYIKGAPERLLSMCDSQQSADGSDEPLDVEYWQEQVGKLAGEGKRVLAIAHRHTSKAHRSLSHEDVQEKLILLGLFGIMDTPREEARAAIAACIDAGIVVKMITGDHKLTASAIGGMLGIPGSARVITGAEIDHMSDDALAQSVEDVNIYARMHPEHKLRLVMALQAQGEVIAMTGDGVNDAPALKRANVGIAMGRQGTEVAKEASDLVLADDNFTSITHAVEEGRNIYRNIRRTIQFMLVTDGAEGLTLLAATLIGFTLPITPLQILWVNMVTAVTLSLAFAFAPHDASVMRYPPLPLGAPLFTRKTVGAMLWHIALITGGTIGLFLYATQSGSDIAIARTTAVNALVCFQIYYLWGMFLIRNRAAGFQPGHYMPLLVSSVGVIFLQLVFTYSPWMQEIFSTASLGAMEWLKVVAVSSIIMIWLGMEKLIFSRN